MNSLIVDKTSYFKNTLKSFKKAHRSIDDRISEMVQSKLSGKSLGTSFRDHSLTGDLQGLKDCHLFKDVVLVYKEDDDVLQLVGVVKHDDLYSKKSKSIFQQYR